MSVSVSVSVSLSVGLVVAILACLLVQCRPKGGLEVGVDKVGAIAFDPSTDDPAFRPCDEERIAEYYRVFPRYGEGLKTIRDQLRPALETLPGIPGENGYLTVRFIVNCEGAAGRYRILEVDPGYRPKSFPAPLRDFLLGQTRELQGWTPGRQEGEPSDSYYMLTFKIRDGRVVDLLP